MYEKGEGVEKNLDKASNLYKKSSNSNLSETNNSIGTMYFDSEDYIRAYKFYKEASQEGNMYAQYNLGYLYLNGLGVEQNYKEAAIWFAKSAYQGYSSAQNDLGVLYNLGKHTNRDISLAIEWFTKASNQDDENAQENLAYIFNNEKGFINKKEAARLFTILAKKGDINAMYELSLLYRKGEGFEKNKTKADYWETRAIKNGFELPENYNNNRKVGIIAFILLSSCYYIPNFILLMFSTLYLF